MAVKSKEIVIVFGKGGKKCELVLKAGKKDDGVLSMRLEDSPTQPYGAIKINEKQPGKNEAVVDPGSLATWQKAKKAIKRLEVTDQPEPPNSGDAVCFESPMGWYCIE